MGPIATCSRVLATVGALRLLKCFAEIVVEWW